MTILDSKCSRLKALLRNSYLSQVMLRWSRDACILFPRMFLFGSPSAPKIEKYIQESFENGQIQKLVPTIDTPNITIFVAVAPLFPIFVIILLLLIVLHVVVAIVVVIVVVVVAVNVVVVFVVFLFDMLDHVIVQNELFPMV